MRKILKVIIIIAIIGFLAVTGFVIAVFYGAYGHLQSKEELLNYKNANASIVLSYKGELLGKYFSENRTNVTYAELPPHLINALIATEDIRFFRHRGFDTKSLFRVLIKTIILNRNTGGGSTITQQLAKNMYGRANYGRLTILVNKVKEIILARRLEKSFSKQEIILLYLNTVSFGENLYGIEAAARRFFNKEVKDLRVEEAAVLIGILKANNYYNPRLYPENATRRRNVVLSQMKKYEFLAGEVADSMIALPLVQNYINFESRGPADYFLFQVKQEARFILQSVGLNDGRPWNIEEDGLVITTTLDLTLQNYANKAFKEHLSVMQEKLNKQYNSASGKRAAATVADREIKRLNLTGRAQEPSLQEFDEDSTLTKSISVRDSMIQAVKVLQAGLLAMNPVTGHVKAYVGGIDFKTQPYDQILARRQVASTFKPILYAAAFEEGMQPCSYLDNDSITDTGIEGWSPRNFDHTYGGRYSLQGALVHSMNVPTYNLYINIDYRGLDSLWRKMGFSYTLNDYPSVPMGTAEANIREMAIAYSVFANGGYKISPQSIVSIKTHDGVTLWENDFKQERERILSENSATLIRAILRRAVTGGTGTPLIGTYGVTLPFAGKTGTSQDYADAWFAAFNPSLVIVSRVGASSPSIHFNSGSNGSGGTLALPLVARTLRDVQQDKELRQELISNFPELPQELAEELNCPDFREITFFEEIIDIFRGEKKPAEKERDILKPEQPRQRPDQPAKEKKKGLFRRIFERK